MLRLYAQNTNPKHLEQIVRLLEDGGVIVYPTDSVYSLGCHALRERAVERICRIKGINPKEHPLSIVCGSLSEVSRYARVENNVFRLMKRNLPGPFTFLLPAVHALPKVFFQHTGKEVGVRMPNNPIVRQILSQLGAPMMTTSLPTQVTGHRSQVTMTSHKTYDEACRLNAELAEEEFGALVDLVVDGGDGIEAESTIVDCLDDEPTIVRQGIGILEI